MSRDKRLHALNKLSPTEFQRLVEGYSKVANDWRLGAAERIRARRRLRLLRLSRIRARAQESGVN